MNELTGIIVRLLIALLILVAGIFNIDWLLYSRRRGYDQKMTRVMAVFLGTLWVAFEIFELYVALAP